LSWENFDSHPAHFTKRFTLGFNVSMRPSEHFNNTTFLTILYAASWLIVGFYHRKFGASGVIVNSAPVESTAFTTSVNAAAKEVPTEYDLFDVKPSLFQLY
jgi:hypothetical protein